MNKIYFIYQTTNLINGKFYIGKRTTSKVDDGYLGSGKLIQNAIKKYGKQNFKREIICYCESYKELNEMEFYVVTQEFLEIHGKNCYNLRPGGDGGWRHFSWKNKKRRPYTQEEKKKQSERLKGKNTFSRTTKMRSNISNGTKKGIENMPAEKKLSMARRRSNHNKGGGNPKAKPCIVNYKEYSCIKDAIKETGFPKSRICRNIEKMVDGFSWLSK
jgi:hypothetical protein